MSSLRVGLALLLIATAAGCGATPVRPAPAPARTAKPAPRPAVQAAVPAPSQRWFVPYFSRVNPDDSWSPDGALTLAHGDDRTLFLFQARASAPTAQLEFPGGVFECVWSPDGRLIAALFGAQLWVAESRTGKLIAHVPAPTRLARSRTSSQPLLGFMPDSRRLVVDSGADVQVVDSKDGTSEHHPIAITGPARLAPGRSWLAYERDSGLAIYDLDSGRELAADPRRLAPVAWTSAGDQLVATAPEYSVVLAPGRAPFDVPLTGRPRWGAGGTLLAFEGREPCPTCLRQFGLSVVFDLTTRRETGSDTFVPDGPRYGASFDHLQDRATGLVRASVPVPFTVEPTRWLQLEDEHTLVFDSDGWAARLDLAAVRVLATEEAGRDPAYRNSGQLVSCAVLEARPSGDTCWLRTSGTSPGSLTPKPMWVTLNPAR